MGDWEIHEIIVNGEKTNEMQNKKNQNTHVFYQRKKTNQRNFA